MKGGYYALAYQHIRDRRSLIHGKRSVVQQLAEAIGVTPERARPIIEELAAEGLLTVTYRGPRSYESVKPAALPDSLDEWLAGVERQPAATHVAILAGMVRAALASPTDPPGPRPDLYLDGFRSGSRLAHEALERSFWTQIHQTRNTTTHGGTA